METESDKILQEIEDVKAELRSLREKQIVLEARLRKLISDYYMLVIDKFDSEEKKEAITV